MKTGKKIGIAVIVLALVAGTLTWVLTRETKPRTSYDTTTVRRGQIINTVTATGTVEPIVQVEVGTQVSGIIDHIYADYNSCLLYTSPSPRD